MCGLRVALSGRFFLASAAYKLPQQLPPKTLSLQPARARGKIGTPHALCRLALLALIRRFNRASSRDKTEPRFPCAPRGSWVGENHWSKRVWIAVEDDPELDGGIGIYTDQDYILCLVAPSAPLGGLTEDDKALANHIIEQHNKGLAEGVATCKP